MKSAKWLKQGRSTINRRTGTSFCTFHFSLFTLQFPSRRQLHPRAGLAPLELTLVLPTLLCLMALMINFGVAGAWKVRTQVAARYAGWGTVAERTGQSNPPPDNWPQRALLEETSGSNLPVLDELWNSRTDLLTAAVRGPALTSPHQQVPVAVKRRLEMDDDVQRGRAVLDRPLPLLRGATSTGRFGYDLNQDLFDDRWQFFTMGFADNEDLRTDLWYAIGLSELAELDAGIGRNWNKLILDAQHLRDNPQKCHLYALDRDREFIQYYGSAPDFYPRVRGCSMDVNHVSAHLVGPLLGQINTLPRSMTERFGGMYATWICGLEECGYRGPELGELRMKYYGIKTLSRMGNLMPCACKTLPCPPCPPLPGPDNCD